MKLILDIDEDIYLDMKEGDFNYARQVVKSLQATIASAIISGTPLPNITNTLDEMDLVDYDYHTIQAVKQILNGDEVTH